MDSFKNLKGKLESFIRKYYLNELLKGLIFFVAIGLLYFLLVLFVEYLFWLSPGGRTVLFWAFVLVESFLFIRFILFPLLKLFRISKGIDYTEASRIIGKHFPEVNDKLLNLLQLKGNSKQTELLLASIDQKAEELRPVPFSMAVDYKKNLPFLKYAAIPVLVILLIIISGQSQVFSSSYERVVNYKVAYEPPAPFYFQIRNESLKVRENESFIVQVNTAGNTVPEMASVHYDGQTYFMNRISPGVFQYTFEPMDSSFEFYLSGNEVVSKKYSVDVVKVPKMRNFRMFLDFPRHTGLEDKTVEGTGNATVPEGTEIEWLLETTSTDKIEMSAGDFVQEFEREGDRFFLEKQVLNPMNYAISTSNREVLNGEQLLYGIEVVRDEYPELVLEHKMDSLDGETLYFYGKFSDDYGISAVRMVVDSGENSEEKKIIPMKVGRGSIGEFLSSFPDTLALKKGKSYNVFFEVVDNDVLNGYKKIKSKTFSFRKKTEQEEKEERLLQQNEAIKAMDGSLEKLKLSKQELEELSRLEKQNSNLNYNDRKKLENFLKRQKQQNAIMKSFTEKLKKSLDESNEPQNEELKNNLEERLSNREEELQKNEKLLEELEKYSEKIQEEGLSEKLEELSKNSRNQERNLEQILELTKRYYVQEKVQQVANELLDLSKQQEDLAEKAEENTAAAQDSLSKETEETLDELKELEKENEELKKPMDLGSEGEEKEEIREEQKKASENLEQGNKKDAEKQQKKAAEEMKMLGAKMQKQSQMGGMEQMQEDVDMLRQILDNLVTFSFEQEDLMEEFRKMGGESANFASKLRRQDLLKENFEHIDDSLYSLALRNAMISEEITSKVIDVDYNLEQSLVRLSQNDILQGVGSQQYVVTGANDLANLLSSILGNMQQMLSQASGAGSGKGQEMQLQDIIQKQGELNDEMLEGMKKGQKEDGKEGEDGKGGKQEENNGELFRIFQEQQKLRRALEEILDKEGKKTGAGNVEKEMEQIEKELLEKGMNPETLQKMQQLEHKLLELEEAELEQGRKRERESNTNKEEFENDSDTQIIRAREYFETTEILNRQTLPLRQIYKQKVKEYFERGED